HELTIILLQAGLQRLTRKSQALRETLSGVNKQNDDGCLFRALVEGLGYGRDRDFFRAAGLRLTGRSALVPESPGYAGALTPLDMDRLRILYTLSQRWRDAGIWQTLRQIIQPGTQHNQEVKLTIAALRALFQPLSRARADILICNVVLPFAVAVAALENDSDLAARAHNLYLAYPG